VIGVGGAARIWSVKGSSVAAVVAGGCHDTTGWDAAMVTPPDIEARILRLYHAEKWRITDAEMASLNIETDDWHPEWNYTIRPRPSG